MKASLRCAWSIPEIAELHRKIGDGLLHQADRTLQLVLLASGDAHRIALDARLHLHLAVLDELDDLLGELLLDPDADRDDLLDLVAADLRNASELERAHIDTALGQ